MAEEDTRVSRRGFIYINILAGSAALSLFGSSRNEENTDSRLQKLRLDLEDLETQEISTEPENYNTYFDHRFGTNDEVPVRIDFNLPNISIDELLSEEYIEDGAQIFGTMVDNFSAEEQIGHFMIDYGLDPKWQDPLLQEPDYHMDRPELENYFTEELSPEDVYRQTARNQI